MVCGVAMYQPFHPSDHYINKVEKRLKKTVYVNEFTETEPDDVVILGTYSRLWKNTGKREVLKSKAVECNGYLDSPTSHTRDYLAECYTPRKSKIAQRERLSLRSMPLYAAPTIVLDGCYVDIKSAWFSILNIVGWDCDYYPDKWLARGIAPRDFPLPKDKVARSALVSLSRSHGVPVLRHGIVALEPMYNALENPHIYGIIADVLQSIAVVAIEAYGCRYVATDGFIVPTAKAEDFMNFVGSWGLQSRIKAQGSGAIFGAGSYTIGMVSTVRLVNGWKPVDNVDHLVNVNWIWKRIVKCL